MKHHSETPTHRLPARRHILTGAGVLGAIGATSVMGSASALTRQPIPATAPKADHYVGVSKGQFVLNGRTLRFGGANNYYLHQKSHYAIDALLNDAAAMGLSVIRAWAFADGISPLYTALQPRPYVYNEAAFDSLDYAVWKAGKLGIRLVLVLTNNWKDYGGMQQYVSWFLHSNSAINHDKFYTNREIVKCYKAYAQHVIQRRNRYTGLAYNQDPTIMTFELANEPRNRSDPSGATILAWVTEMSAWFKALAPRQLVAIGDEGFYGRATSRDYPYSNYEGNHWEELIAVPHVDYGTVHLYPAAWGELRNSKLGHDPVAWGTTWITDHLRDGKRIGKPVVIEEFGLQVNARQGIVNERARTAAYTAWTNAVEAHGGAGDQFWLLASRVGNGSYYPDYDGFTMVWDNRVSNKTNGAAHVLSAHAKQMSGRA